MKKDVEIKNRHFLVVGLGISGVAATRFLISCGGRVTATDIRSADALCDTVREIQDLGAVTALGGHDPALLDDVDGVIISPGVPHYIPFLSNARDRGVPVIGEIELAARFIKTPVVAVTGTNGKTTVTEWIGDMLRRSGKQVFVGGNIGQPFIGFVQAGQPADVAVLELSSFQLDTIEQFRPDVAVLLNITPDHLDRYPSMDAYAWSKFRIFKNQGPGDAAVLNKADAWTATLADVAGAIPQGVDRLFFSSQSQFKARMKLTGRHNLENLAAANLAALLIGATPDGVQESIDNFAGLNHRLTYVATIHGVRFYNDSKATNVDAAARALEAFDAPVLLIMGGRTKGGGFASLAGVVRKRVKGLFLMGEAAETLKADIGCEVPTRMVGSMDEAVREAFSAADSGDVVLLSPACASFDMYASYAQRGEDFCRCVTEQKVTELPSRDR